MFKYIATLCFCFIFINSLTAQSPSKTINLGFVGDIMVHNSQLRRAWLGNEESEDNPGYDFNPSFEWFSPYLNQPDIMTGNLETTLGGPNSAWIGDERYAFREYQAYPTFTTPDELAAALSSAGFDILGTANNHCMDSNLEGAARTLEILRAQGLETTGTAASGSPLPWRGDVGGFSISIIAWTASVNGLISSRGMEGINVFNARGHDGRLQEMLDEIRHEASLNRDLVILSIHWGQEYFNEPDQYQKNLADLAIEAGADVIIGSHPHVFQPVEIRDGVFVAWSLGNFISSQRYHEGEKDWVDGSAMLNLEIDRDSSGRARVKSASFIPLYVHWTRENIRVLAIADGMAPGAEERYGLTDYDNQRIEALNTHIASQITRYMGALPAEETKFGWKLVFF